MKETTTPLILAVDDSRSALSLLRSRLEEANFRVITATSGAEGLETALAHLPDCVLCDFEMPEMTGPEFCAKFKANRTINHIPVIMLTSKVDKESIITSVKAGADDFISKSSDPEIIFVKIHAMLRLKKLREESLSMEGIKAINAMIVTYQHELMNPLMIAMNSIPTEVVGQKQEEKLEKLRGALNRIAEIVKKIGKVSEGGIEYSGYSGKTEMVKLKKEDTE